MTGGCFILALASIVLTATSAAATSDQTIFGTSSDPRVTRCGIAVTKGEMILVRPFIDASNDLDGSYRVDLDKVSASGHSRMVQTNAFTGGTLGNVSLQVNAGAKMVMALSVKGQDGRALCALNIELDFSGDAASI
jgi:hypothetical protein